MITHLPGELSQRINIQSANQIHIGKSKSDVYRVEGWDGADYFLKVSRSDYVAREIEREIQILRWLQGKGLPVPQPAFFKRHEGQVFFLLSEIPGASLAEVANSLAPEELMRLGARFLRRIHQLDLRECPFDRRLSLTLSWAREHLDAGWVDETDFDSDHQGKTARVLFEELTESLPKEDLVFTHGDYCFPNIIYQGGEISGVVDLGRAGVADRYQDIGLFLRSFRFNKEEVDTALFIEEYGLISELDKGKMSFYRKLDEFF